MPARRPAVRGFAGSAAALLGVGLVGFTAAPAAADPFSADTAAALVDAIEDANDTPGADVITITAPITLTSDLPAIETDLEIIGGGHAISAAGFGGLVVTGDVSVSITELEVVGAAGHGIASDGADLLLDDVLVDGSGGDGLNAVGGSVTVIASDFTESGGVGASITTTGDVTITGSEFRDNGAGGLVVDAAGAAAVEISGSSAISNGGTGVRLLAADDASITAVSLWASLSGDDGFAITASGSGSVTLESSGASQNEEDGLWLEAADASRVELLRVETVANQADGIDIDDSGPEASISITESTVASNGGTGIEANVLTGTTELTIERTTVAANGESGISADVEDDARIVVRNSTVSGNTGSCVAGMLVDQDADDQDGHVELVHSTVWNNDGGEDCPQVGFAFLSTILVSHSIIAGTDWDLADSGSPIATVEWSLLGTFDPEESSENLADAVADPSNIFGDPALAPLADNGGPTETHALLDGSAAFDGGDPAIMGAPTTDQRNLSRVAGAAIDIGAVEMPAPAPEEPGDEEPAGGLPPTGSEPTGIVGIALLLLLAGAAALAARRARRA